MKIAIYANAIFRTKGGVERVAASLANFLYEKKHTVYLLHALKTRQEPVYELCDGIRTFEIVFSNEALPKMRKFFIDNDFDVVCMMSSTNERAFFVSIMNGLDTPLIFSEHGQPDYIERFISSPDLRRYYFDRADALHFLSPKYCENLSPENLKKTFVIPNFSILDEVDCSKTTKLNDKIILSVANLCEYPKRLSLLIKAFYLINKQFPDWKCVVCGDGIDKERYIDLIQALGLETKVQLIGEVPNIVDYYGKASIFCLPSEVEGFPCALVEAQHYGVPSVGFASCTGVNEIILHGENGFLAPDFTPESLGRCLESMMLDPHMLQTMKENSILLSRRYDPKKLLEEWCNHLEAVAALKGKIIHRYGDTVDYEHIMISLAYSFKLRRESHLLASEISRLKEKKNV